MKSRPQHSRARGAQNRRRSARRPWFAAVARRAEFFYLAQGLSVAVILVGMFLIILGLGVSLVEFSGDLSALASEEGPPPVALAGMADFEPPVLPRIPTSRAAETASPLDEPAAQGAGDAASESVNESVDKVSSAKEAADDEVGFVPLEVPSDRTGEHAPVLPVTGRQPLAEPWPHSVHLPMLMAPGSAAAPQEVAAPVDQAPVDQAPVELAAPVDQAQVEPRVMPPPGPPDQIRIPGIELEAPVVHAPIYTVKVRGQVFEQWLAPDTFAAGWQQGSALAGAPGNTVLTGHHNINGQVFRRLHELSQGDDIFLLSGEHTYPYVVSQVMIFEERGVGMQQRQENARWILDSDDERLTLVTCWPPDSNTHRLLVVAVPNP